MDELKLPPVGFDSFEEIREKNCLYIDKTEFLIKVLGKGRPESINVCPILLFTRPRCFGKSLNLSALADFLDITKDSSVLFEGLAVMQHPEVVESWMNKHPVLRVSFKNVSVRSQSSVLDALRRVVRSAVKRYRFLAESCEVPEDNRTYFKQVLNDEIADAKLPDFLSELCEALYFHYQQKVFIIVDEYDVPLSKVMGTEFYEQTMDFMRSCFDFLKGNELAAGTVLSGCLRLAGESLFTGLNNFRAYGLNDEAYAADFGFSEAEVKSILKLYGLEAHYQEIKEWYDGYLIGGERMFCPWNVMNYVLDLLMQPETMPRLYWYNTASTDIIEEIMGRWSLYLRNDVEKLLSGGSILAPIKENLTYNRLLEEAANFWSLLFFSGYVTFKEERLSPDNQAWLTIPNREIKEVFVNIINSIINKSVQQSDMSKLYCAFLTGDRETAENLVNGFVRRTISYFDYRENFYHALTLGMFAAFHGHVFSNQENGLGRSDIAVLSEEGRTAVIIEIKAVKKEEQIDLALEETMRQIREKRYADPYQDYGYQVLACALVFHRKSCRIAFEKVG